MDRFVRFLFGKVKEKVGKDFFFRTDLTNILRNENLENQLVESVWTNEPYILFLF